MSSVRLIQVGGRQYRTYKENLTEMKEQICTKLDNVPPLQIEFTLFTNSLKSILGYSKTNLLRIEEQTNSKIKCKSHPNRQTTFSIYSAKVNEAITARKMLECSNKQCSSDLTHFISFPLNRDHSLTVQYNEFRNLCFACITDCSKEKINSLLMPTRKLHLTVSVLVLEGEDIQKVIKLLGETKPKSMSIRLRGLSIMKGDPGNCHVLYAKILDTTSLDEWSQHIIAKLVEEGLSSTLAVKWHSTVLNTKYADGKPFNALKLLDVAGNFDFGEATIKELHLSKFKGPLDECGYYPSEAIIAL